jgi:DNA repair photolyase
MSIIYEPKGKALEYSPLAANLYKGCSHSCIYCYAPSATFKDRKIFHSDEYIRPRAKVLEQFEKDCKKYAGDQREILFSFTTDPYQKCETEINITRQALEIALKYDLFPVILTKGGTNATKDFDILTKFKNRKFGVSLTHDVDSVSLEWEPGAALPQDRIKALMEAWTLGIETFVSFEPVIDPDAVMRLIDSTHEFVDFYKVGKLNYHQHSKSIDWVSFRESVINKLESLGKRYMIKKDLLAA